jgi:hypothetical protein
MTDPFNQQGGNPFFQTQQQLGTRQAQNLNQTNMSNITRNIGASGFGGGITSPFAQEMMANQMRAGSGMTANLGFLNPVQNALQQQNMFSNIAANFRPLQTGGKQVDTVGGLGTMMPLLSAGLSLATAPMTGGGSLLGSLGNLFSGFGAGQGMTAPQSPYFAGMDYGNPFAGESFGGGAGPMGGSGMAGVGLGGYSFPGLGTGSPFLPGMMPR